MASFSSRGPNRAEGFFTDLIVPNVTAPGRAIWAAYHQGEGGDGDYTFNVIQGTSMSSPHVAGAGALMAAAQPNWTPAEIQSALMLTARTVVTDDSGIDMATPFAQGAGRIDLSKAPKAGFVLDISTNDFLAADPREGGDVRTLNLASLGNASCVGSCMWTRTLKSTQDSPVDYVASAAVMSGTITVEPASFTLAAGGTQVVTVSIQIDAGVTEADGWLFGQVDIKPATNAAIPDAHMPVAVQYSAGDLPESIAIVTPRDAGSRQLGVSSITASDLTVNVSGLTKATQTHFELYQDPTNDVPDEFYDDLGQVFWMPIQVPANSQALVAEILETTSPDLDMAVGYDTNGDGRPSLDEQQCMSATGGSFESCWVSEPQAGTWWVVVLNWEESDAAPDTVTLVTAVVPMTDGGNLQVQTPSSVEAGVPYDITVFWDVDMMAGDKFYGAINMGTDPAHPSNIGTIPVYVTRTENDVVKTAEYVGPSGPKAGETLTYRIVVAPNTTQTPLTYHITDTIPAGLTYVPDSVTGGASVDGNVVTWSGVQVVPERKYGMTTSLDTAMCTMPLANSGSYVDLEAYNIKTNPDVSGNNVSFNIGWDGGGYPYFGDPRTDMLTISDDGIVTVGEDGLAGAPYMNTAIPSASQPNALLALMWNDMEIVYDEATNRGATTGVRLTSGGVPSAKLLEFDDLQLVGDPSSTLDFQLLMRNSINDAPGAYEIVYAYDNLTGAFTDPMTGTIGLEDYDGLRGLQYAYNDANLKTLENGMAICFDWFLDGAPHVITFDVTVDADVEDFTVITNTVESITDNPGAKVETSEHHLVVGARPIINITPDPLNAVVSLGQSRLETVAVHNSGTQDLNWSVEESLGASMPVSALAPAQYEFRTQRADGVKNPVSAQTLQAIQAAAAGTVVADGSFEAGSPSPYWGETGTNVGTPLCDLATCGADRASDGSWYAWFGAWGAYEASSVTQTVTIPVTTTLLSFDYRAGRCGDAADYLKVTIDGNVVWSVDSSTNPCVVSGDYQRQTVGISTYADGAVHELAFSAEVNGSSTADSSLYIDNVSIEEGVLCTPGNIPWARNVTPNSGTTKPGATSEFTVIFDAAGLDLGVYTGELCVNSNDPNAPLKLVPVEMTVAYPPVINDQTFSVVENSPAGTEVGMVKVVDLDPGDKVTFAIVAGNEDGAFALSSATNGRLSVVDGTKLDYESKISYILDVKVTDKYGLTDSAKVTVNVTDVDDVPSNTDGNGDGIPDSQQANVETILSDMGNQVTVAAPDGLTLQNVRKVTPSVAPPQNVEMAQGMFGFDAVGVSAGGSVSVTIIVQSGPIATSYWKYGPTPDNTSDHWYEFTYNSTTGTGAQINGRTITLYFVDGQRGDSDLTANGTITDPGGPGGKVLSQFIYLPRILQP
jgi:uncharacterized repeat protein (TIGR01451 family)